MMSAMRFAKVLGTVALVSVFAAEGVQAGGDAAAGETVTLESLLDEMVDRDRVARLPSPAYLCKQFSSYDRASKNPDDPEGWFANVDRYNFLRTETNAGRMEWVLMDHTGAGAVTRIWTPAPPDASVMARSYGRADAVPIVRFYFDGSDKPAIEAPWLEWSSGKGAIPEPFAYVSRRAGVVFLPIPYAKRCKVTLDVKPFYYIFNYREYEKGANVETFSSAALEKARKKLDAVGKALLAAPSFDGGKTVTVAKSVAPGASESAKLPAGPAAVRTLQVTVDPREPQALRSTVLRMSFDGEESVWCPVGDFFGSGVGYNPMHGWYRTVDKSGTMTCRWVMPYAKSGSVTVENLGKAPVTVKLVASVGDWTWDKRSMRFHGTWRQQYPLATRPFSDWNYVTVKGRGVYVGDTLAIMNPAAKWWGEGDEKIWVDDEYFPSHFGTGTEDYYGYAWGGKSNDFYTKPFHAQPRCGPATFGHNTQTRTRVLDAIPFTQSLKLDMEVWHWGDCDVAYAAATHWYALPGATSNRGPAPDEAARDIPAPPDKPLTPKPRPRPPGGKGPKPLKVPGAIEFEDFQPTAKSPGVELMLQPFPKYRWSGGKQWLIRATKVGDFVEFSLPAGEGGRREIVLHATKAVDYGQYRISVNGRAIDETFEFYNKDVVKTGPIELGAHEPSGGKFVLRFEVVGSNAAAEGAKTFLGLDCIVLKAP